MAGHHEEVRFAWARAAANLCKRSENQQHPCCAEQGRGPDAPTQKQVEDAAGESDDGEPRRRCDDELLPRWFRFHIDDQPSVRWVCLAVPSTIEADTDTRCARWTLWPGSECVSDKTYTS